MPAITTPRERIAHLTRMRHSRVRFSGSVASCRMLWSVGCIIDMFESEFSVHKPFIIAMPEGHPLAGESRIRVALLADEPQSRQASSLSLASGDRFMRSRRRASSSRESSIELRTFRRSYAWSRRAWAALSYLHHFGEWPCQALLIVNSLGPSEMRCWRPPAAKTIRRRQ